MYNVVIPLYLLSGNMATLLCLSAAAAMITCGSGGGTEARRNKGIGVRISGKKGSSVDIDISYL